MRQPVSVRVARFRQRRFERLVSSALDDLPPAVAAMLNNVEIVIEDEPTPAQLARATTDDELAPLFGLYEGVPQTERGQAYTLVLPDKVTIFRGPLERACASPAAIRREVRITVAHELGHHFGFDEAQLAALGLS